MTVSSGRVAAVVALFEERTGRAPEGVWAAPGRVNLIGEHTDYNDGFVLPVAIDRQAVVAAARRSDDVLRCWSAQEGEAPAKRLPEIGPGRSSGWSAYPEGAAWALMARGVPVAGTDVVVESDVPPGAGLSSSAALIGAVGLALAELYGARLTRSELALAGREAERRVAGAPVGVMDHMVAMLGRAGHALFLDTRRLAGELVPLHLAAEGLLLAVIDTRVAHRLADGAYAERQQACQEAARMLGVAALRDVSLEELERARARLGDLLFRRARHVVSENARVLEAAALLREGRAAALGPALARSHASLRDDFEVSVPQLDVAVAGAEAAGAVGARLTGAGFGGSALALVPGDRLEEVARRVRSDFAEAGFDEPGVYAVEADDGGGRARWP
ncbi:MAG: galactokinase [Actinomycetota bacterium]|nr:galactokinase [Actinomycetota bacterium]